MSLIKNSIKIMLLAPLFTLIQTQSHAYPVDPNKVPVSIGQDAKSLHDFQLAYDSSDKSIIYYAPKTGRVATINGMPTIGFQTLPDGTGVLNVQFETGVFGSDRELLIKNIEKAGFKALPFPFFKTKVVPLTPGMDPVTKKPICITEEDPSTGEKVTTCDPTLYSSLAYSNSGPSLNQNIAVSGFLNKIGASVYKQMLRGGNALQINLHALYYSAGDAFTATVEVNYSKLFQSYHVYSSNWNGFLDRNQLNQFWVQEGLCFNKPADQCGVRITYKDSRGNTITNITIDPNNKEAQEKLLQSVERLRQKLEDQLFSAIAHNANIGDSATTAPQFNYKINETFFRKETNVNAKFEFQSPRGLNVSETVFPLAVGCIQLSDDGSVNRNLQGDCKKYWSGT
ncbi:hypothetical protein [Fluviispira multicolorata]|uniref:Uncharacterized protein n=1 Tax=Fluviispira multicolorata TaxID=2654512 RepID=A0A833N6Q1_9BACT|nr:hypothetical protein [Fluviispira multicolorata]KAB8033790.1 hypothetical protein GCL57_03520 [Fluviispira multicolorata]